MAFRWRGDARHRRRVRHLAQRAGISFVRRRGKLALTAVAVVTAAMLGFLVHLLEEPTRFQQAAAAVSEPAVALPAPPARPPAAEIVPPPSRLAEEEQPFAHPVPPPPPADARLFLADLPVAMATPPALTQPDAEPPADQPQWQRNAVAAAVTPGQPRIAIVIDDLGPGRAMARRAIGLPAPLTLAFLPYAEGLEALTGEARAAGHELLVHLPMEPIDLAHNSPGPNALMTGLGAAEIEKRLAWGLARFDGYVGINNHMGSAFTTDVEGLAVVMAELQRRGLLFLDSRTIGSSLAESAALAAGVPALGRDVFLDNAADDTAAIWAQLRLVERIARDRGQAVAIGHPHPATLAVLAEWLPQAQAAGFALVPVSALATPPTRALVVSVKP